jgi:hypothetical protein
VKFLSNEGDTLFSDAEVDVLPAHYYTARHAVSTAASRNSRRAQRRRKRRSLT